VTVDKVVSPSRRPFTTACWRGHGRRARRACFINVDHECARRAERGRWRRGARPMLAHKGKGRGRNGGRPHRGRVSEVNYRRSRSVIYTGPRLLGGLTEEEVKKTAGSTRSAASRSWQRPRAAMEAPAGFAKLIAARDETRSWACTSSGHGGRADCRGVLALEYSASAEDCSARSPHPTLSEAVHERRSTPTSGRSTFRTLSALRLTRRRTPERRPRSSQPRPHHPGS